MRLPNIVITNFSTAVRPTGGEKKFYFFLKKTFIFFWEEIFSLFF